MRRSIGLIGLFLSCAIISSSPAEVASNKPPLPFALSWTKGTCPNCETARSLSDVQFVSPNEAWGIGYNPPGETGAGDYSIVLSRDGGKTWSELPHSYQHNSSPSISFADQHEGWIMISDVVEAEQRLLYTHDGGAHWHRLPLRDLFVGGIEYLGNGIGHAYSFDIYKKQGMLLRTKDHGRHWQSSALPEGFSPDHMKFLDADHGVLTGCINQQQLLVLKTADAGRHWSQAELNLPLQAPNETYCEFETDALDLIDAQNGWILVNKHSFLTGDSISFGMLFKTSDGGANWTKIFQTTSSNEQIELSEARLLSPKIGFISKTDTPDGSLKHRSNAQLLFTVDGGATWDDANQARKLWGCRPYSGDLICASGEEFSFARISPTPAP